MDLCIFIAKDVVVLVYVHNCLIFLQDKDKINQLLDKLKNKEKMGLTDEGDVDKYLGVEIERNKEINQYLSSKKFSFKESLN